jgi:hypothetical protein
MRPAVHENATHRCNFCDAIVFLSAERTGIPPGTVTTCGAFPNPGGMGMALPGHIARYRRRPLAIGLHLSVKLEREKTNER